MIFHDREKNDNVKQSDGITCQAQFKFVSFHFNTKWIRLHISDAEFVSSIKMTQFWNVIIFIRKQFRSIHSMATIIRILKITTTLKYLNHHTWITSRQGLDDMTLNWIIHRETRWESQKSGYLRKKRRIEEVENHNRYRNR